MTTGILLTNTGTPTAPTPEAVKTYLAEFLSDPRIVQIPRLVWLPILHGIILRTRPAKSAALYQNIWTKAGSPLRVYMESIASQLQTRLQRPVAVGMNYGSPSMMDALQTLHYQDVTQIICLPLFPQYSNTSIGSSKDRVASALKKLRFNLKTDWIDGYAASPDYIAAIAKQVNAFWQENGKAEKLLISYHGIPERLVKNGDPYQSECEMTTRLLVDALHLTSDQFIHCYQSQFGYDKWLKPSTQALIQALPKQGVKTVDVICPGFAVDCLETLEEIAIQGALDWKVSGGDRLRYIKALNDSTSQIELLASLL